MATDTVTNTTTIDEWLQFCQETLMEDNAQATMPNEGGFFDATSEFVEISEANMNPRNSCSSDSLLSPKRNLSKPIRRRSRISKKTPITLLNANTSNFRSLVQKFTGCPSKSAGSLAGHRGPITLNFQKGTRHFLLQNQSKVMQRMSDHHDPVVSTPSLTQAQQMQQQKLLVSQPQEAIFSLENSFSEIFPSGLSNSQPMAISDHGFLFNEDITLPELTVSSFITSDGQVKDDSYFM